MSWIDELEELLLEYYEEGKLCKSYLRARNIHNLNEEELNGILMQMSRVIWGIAISRLKELSKFIRGMEKHPTIMAIWNKELKKYREYMDELSNILVVRLIQGCCCGSPFLRIDSIINWPAFVQSFKDRKEARIERIWDLLDEEIKKKIDLINNSLVDIKKPEKQLIIGGINSLLEKGNLYNKSVFNDRGLIKKHDRRFGKSSSSTSGYDYAKFNRFVIESVFPGIIDKQPRQDTCRKKHNICCWFPIRSDKKLSFFLQEAVIGFTGRFEKRYKCINQGMIFEELRQSFNIETGSVLFHICANPEHEKQEGKPFKYEGPKCLGELWKPSHYICNMPFDHTSTKSTAIDSWVFIRDNYRPIKMWRCRGSSTTSNKQVCGNYFSYKDKQKDECPLVGCSYSPGGNSYATTSTVFIIATSKSQSSMASVNMPIIQEKEIQQGVSRFVEEWPWLWLIVLCMNSEGDPGADVVKEVIENKKQSNGYAHLLIILERLFMEREPSVIKKKGYRKIIQSHVANLKGKINLPRGLSSIYDHSPDNIRELLRECLKGGEQT